MSNPVHIVIVTHNSAGVIDVCLEHLKKQSVPLQTVIIVDSGSDNTEYLDGISKLEGMKVVKTENIGFARANNLGLRKIESDQNGLVVFMNPDTFLPSDYIAKVLQLIRDNPRAAIVSGKLMGFDFNAGKPTGKIDSSGIYRKWYGRWYDRGQGQDDTGQFDLIDNPPAVCGALLCCRSEALQRFAGQVFDPDFFLYKEDIELGIRLRKNGWELIYDPRLTAFHCRGWGLQRKKIGYDRRLIAARSEVLLYRKHPDCYIVWAYLKLFLVRFFHL